jgi:hypothetical protein
MDLTTDVILLFDFCGCETSSVAIENEDYRLKVFDNTVLRTN